MSSQQSPADMTLLDLLRKSGPSSVSQLSGLMGVTATAVRQRLNRMMGAGFVERGIAGSGRGRPSHHYSLTKKGRSQTGANFADLSIALWKEIRAIEDPVVRRGLIIRLSRRMAELYSDRIRGATLAEKMEAVSELFQERQIPFSVDRSRELPVLTAEACPYPDLAEMDRGICAGERAMFSELLGEDLRLSQCRLDGETTCCTFEPKRQSAAEDEVSA